jgi:hypothetical protein
MIRSTFDQVTLDIISEGLQNIVDIVKANAKQEGLPATESDIRKLIEVSNKLAIENEG